MSRKEEDLADYYAECMEKKYQLEQEHKNPTQLDKAYREAIKAEKHA